MEKFSLRRIYIKLLCFLDKVSNFIESWKMIINFIHYFLYICPLHSKSSIKLNHFFLFYIAHFFKLVNQMEGAHQYILIRRAFEYVWWLGHVVLVVHFNGHHRPLQFGHRGIILPDSHPHICIKISIRRSIGIFMGWLRNTKRTAHVLVIVIFLANCASLIIYFGKIWWLFFLGNLCGGGIAGHLIM